MNPLRRWRDQEGEDMDAVIQLLADRYLDFHSIAKR